MNAAKAQLDLIPTRRSLLSRLRDLGDQESWSDFFHSYWRLIYEVALKAGLSDADAQEVVQETVISVAKQMPGFKYDRAKGSFKNWLQNTTRWRIQDQLRKRPRGAVVEALVALHSDYDRMDLVKVAPAVVVDQRVPRCCGRPLVAV